MIKIIAVSDTHLVITMQKLLAGVEADILIHAGDFLNSGSDIEYFMFLEQIDKIRNQFGSIILSAGNHDKYVQQMPEFCKKEATNAGASLVIDKEIRVKGLRIFCSPWTPRFGYGWAYQLDPGNKHWNCIPEGLDILVTHGPPQGILDKVPDYFHKNNGEDLSVGDPELLQRLCEMKNPPKISVHGHLHAQGGENKKWKTYRQQSPLRINHEIHSYNVAICNERYRPENPITTIDIDEKD